MTTQETQSVISHGFNLQIHDLPGYQLLYSQLIFQNQAIHGIRHLDGGSEGSQLTFEVLVWGGSLVAILQVEILHDEKNRKISIALVDKQDVGDWILDVSRTLSQITGFVTLTAHNVLHKVYRSSTERNEIVIDILGRGPFTFLYSGHILVVGNDTIIVASGTVFGEVLLWTCKTDAKQITWTTTPRYVFCGHKGSVFGVCISNTFTHEDTSRRLLASCSDDRSIILWDVTGCEQNPVSDTKEHFGTRTTGFGENITEKAYLAKTWGHVSRIWGVCFVPGQATEHSNLPWLVSRGEDGACQTWRLDHRNLFNRSQSNTIQPFEHDRHHSGKNIWSLTVDKTSQESTIYSSGADSQIVARKIGDTSATQVSFSSPFRNIPVSAQAQNGEPPSSFTFKSLKSYLVLDSSHVLAATDSGTLLGGRLDGGTICWRQVAASVNKSLLILSTNSSSSFAVFADSYDNSVYVFHQQLPRILSLPVALQSQVERLHIAWSSTEEEMKTSSICLLVSLRKFDDLQLLWITTRDGKVDVIQTSVSLPETFTVASCFYEPEQQLLILGSRSGALAVYEGLTSQIRTIQPTLCRRHVHGSDTVTCITKLPANDCLHGIAHVEYFLLTTGRDGSCVVSRLWKAAPLTNNFNLEIVHQGFPPIGPNIEGSIVLTTPNAEPSIILYGFQSKDFVAWDESKQVKLLSVDCGGAHRSWDFHLDTRSPPSATFVWTKAGHFHLHKRSLVTHEIIQRGGHGREIKAVAVHKVDEGEYLIATGAEDTDIRLFSYRSSQKGGKDTFKMLTILRRHTTGLQCLRFSPCGRFLFSAAGMEELYIWKLSPVPVLSIGVKFMDEIPHEEEISDARIMSIDVITRPNKPETEFIVLAAYSNGKLKAIRKRVRDQDEDPFTYMQTSQIDFGALCLTQVSLVDVSAEQHSLAVVGATNGFLHVYAMTGMHDWGLDFLGCRKIHQSSISALEVVRLNQNLTLAVTGGDDNALAITLIEQTASDERVSTSTLLIPKAHAAALTAVAIVSKEKMCQEDRVRIVTAGNDQRVKLWSVDICEVVEMDHVEEISQVQVDLVHESWTSVADVSGMEILPKSRIEKTQESEHGVAAAIDFLVVGVGMEVMRFEVKHADS